MRAASQLDEGYSEDTRSDADASDASMSLVGKDSYYESLLDAALGLPVDQRRDIAYAISKTLPVSHIAYNKSRLDCLLYFDPVAKLPNELFYLVLAELEPSDLLNASAVSRPWRERTRDERLWRHCFAKQGWILDSEKKGVVEEEAKEVKDIVTAVNNSTSKRSGQDLERRPSRKRGREEAFSEGEPSADTLPPPLSRPRSRAGSGNSMEGVEIMAASKATDGISGGSEQDSAISSSEVDARPDSSASDSAVEDLSHPDDLQLQPTMFQPGQPKLSWPWLYKHRRLLERNWEKGNYKMFSLPHPEHQAEGHDECVYTIQHSGSNLVSGSRDKTIRVWDLESCRLKIPPLKGHQASVLCLQFDDRPEHDIIVSGGSDSWVIIWKFSTGEILQKMTQAHSESVLNLRFDDRYIVTCSKDKSIKIWNRRAIARHDPLVPQFVLPKFNNPEEPDAGKMIKEYTMLCALYGHHAAVNAVQIHEHTIVSASGDRTIKAWNIHTGQATKTYFGHTKGIACVQFDGRRIVSGSSDQTVRIFDAEKTVEVACLEGHGNLVRTVQARFGDMDLMTDEDLSEEARKADRGVYKYLAQGGQLATTSRRGHRNAGSSNPQDMMSIGAKVPPGGGGSRWARIVSGSYDERVIIWAKDRDGNWRPQHSLSQDYLLKHPTRRNVNRVNNLPIPANYGDLNAQAPHSTASPFGPMSFLQSRVVQQFGNINSLLRLGHPTQASSHSSLQEQYRTLTTNQLHLHNQLNPGIGSRQPGPASSTAARPDLTTYQRQTLPSAQSSASAAAHAAVQQAQQVQQILPTPVQQPQAQPNPSSTTQNGVAATNTNNNQNQSNAATGAGTSANGANTINTNQAGQPGHQHAHHNHGPAHLPQPHAARANSSDSSRVFKLQFDARRIVCCSQNRTIVGWDFANGDKELELVGNLSNETL